MGKVDPLRCIKKLSANSTTFCVFISLKMFIYCVLCKLILLRKQGQFLFPVLLFSRFEILDKLLNVSVFSWVKTKNNNNLGNVKEIISHRCCPLALATW